MLSSITWSQYFTCLFYGTIIYYAFVWLVVFNRCLPFGYALPFQTVGEDAPDEVLTSCQHVMDELRPLFHGQQNKNELLVAIRQTLSKYKEWDEPTFRQTMTAFIVQEFASKCSIRLGEEDQRALW